jgi:diguanylate cyclase (GGDEF)-like protein
MDMNTLHVEHAVLLGLLTLLTLINCRLHRGAKGIYWFPAFTLCAFIGAVLVALRGHISDAVSIFFGMTFFHFAYVCLHRGLDGFFEGRDYPRWPLYLQYGAFGVAVAGLVEFGLIHPSTANRLICYSLVFAIQTGLIAGVVFRNSRGELRFAGGLMGGMLGLLSVNNLVRAYETILRGAPSNYLKVGFALQLTVLETSVLQTGIAIAFVWMTAAVLQERLQTLASTDSLTGLLNRRALEVAAEREIALAGKSRHPLAAVLIDLDRFKLINDSYGHAFGDRTLVEVARCLQDHMRRSDLLARVGGDEFALLLHNTTQVEAMEIAERLRSSLAKLVIVDGGISARVSASIGLAQADGSTEDWNELMIKCDKALYAVKEAGGNLALVS